MNDIICPPPPVETMTVGRYLRLRREAAGHSIDELAFMLGSSTDHRATMRCQLGLLEDDKLGSGITLAFINVLAASRPFAFDDHVANALLARRLDPAGDLPLPQVCRSCGCSWHDACETSSGPCSWVNGDPTLCSACLDREAAHG